MQSKEDDMKGLLIVLAMLFLVCAIERSLLALSKSQLPAMVVERRLRV